MVENAIYRYKAIIDRSMRSRALTGQRVEVQLACRVLHTMAHLEMPGSYRGVTVLGGRLHPIEPLLADLLVGGQGAEVLGRGSALRPAARNQQQER